VAPLLLSAALLDQVKLGSLKTVVAISSILGSIKESEGSSNYYSYRASKAACNMNFTVFAGEVAGDGIRVKVLHPGWVATSSESTCPD
jgi:NAD(P)-dependent dehydrogenase (short-subunit alcohol dehydrogenase family)